MRTHFDAPTTTEEDRQDLLRLESLREADSAAPDLPLTDDDVVMQVSVLRVLQGDGTASGGLTTEPKLRRNSIKRPNTSDYRELHRLMYGKDPVDDKPFQDQKLYLGSCVKLSDKQLLVVLSLVALTRPLGAYAVGRAMGIKKNHILLLRKQALKIMNLAPTRAAIEKRIERAQEMRPASPDC